MLNYIKKIALTILNNFIRKSSLFTYFIFRVKAKQKERIFWDFTTIVLKKALKRHAIKNSKILEIGTGPYALLSIYAAKFIKSKVTACDINLLYVNEAIGNINANNVSIDVIESNLFSAINSKYDLIFFNSIYIPLQTGINLGIDKLHNQQSDWCGGTLGIDTIEIYLKDAASHLNRNGKLLLGYNFKYLKESIVKDLTTKYNYEIIDKCYLPFNPSVVYIMSKRI